ncbi:hypothetical protein T265_07524 [Opisthorchis viverrini]|uniref:Uncharacterized protein n=1 Tax=Opisthorchis viverrini TaxID=6198 RepID=A0A075AB92_OPIVI|nr:hypothetical protein T265_07524 [Opisthorchis viverrini]KER24899.1 hypothetical protein T265_07524 [Opisthorchis viverrini]
MDGCPRQADYLTSPSLLKRLRQFVDKHFNIVSAASEASHRQVPVNAEIRSTSEFSTRSGNWVVEGNTLVSGGARRGKEESSTKLDRCSGKDMRELAQRSRGRVTRILEGVDWGRENWAVDGKISLSLPTTTGKVYANQDGRGMKNSMERVRIWEKREKRLIRDHAKGSASLMRLNILGAFDNRVNDIDNQAIEFLAGFGPLIVSSTSTRTMLCCDRLSKRLLNREKQKVRISKHTTATLSSNGRLNKPERDSAIALYASAEKHRVDLVKLLQNRELRVQKCPVESVPALKWGSRSNKAVDYFSPCAQTEQDERFSCRRVLHVKINAGHPPAFIFTSPSLYQQLSSSPWLADTEKEIGRFPGCSGIKFKIPKLFDDMSLIRTGAKLNSTRETVSPGDGIYKII